MAFWSGEKLRELIPKLGLITPYQESRVAEAAYELSLGPEAYSTTKESADLKIVLSEGQQFEIPPGQIALLLTEEGVIVPDDVIAFISMKSGVKLRGLINISGFHVDPGFQGRLKFSVYNAGSRNVVLERGHRLFLIWYSDLIVILNTFIKELVSSRYR